MAARPDFSWGPRPHRIAYLQEWQERALLVRTHEALRAALRRVGTLFLDTATIHSFQVRPLGRGEDTGPSPVVCRKKGSQHARIVGQAGTLLVIFSAGANVSNDWQIIQVVVALLQAGRSQDRLGRVTGDVCRLRV